MTAKEFWKERFDEYPKTDADKLAVAMMAEYADQIRQQTIDAILQRIEYGKLRVSTGYTSGWTGNESGECCDKCRMSDDETNPLRVRVGCRNPFQLAEVCQCHIPFRKVAEDSIQNTLENLLLQKPFNFKIEKIN